MLSTIASLLAVAYLPGALIFRLPLADRARRAALPAEERLFWMVTISVIVSTTAVLVLAALDVYTLGLLVGTNILLAVVLALGSLGNLRLGSTAHWPGTTALLPTLLIVLGAWMYFARPAAEYVLGGRDPGVYVNEGIQIAQRRSLTTVDAVAASVPASWRNLFFPSYGEAGYQGLAEYGEAGYYSVRFMGFHLRDPETGTVTGQFPQGYPAWIAIAYALDGVTGTRRVIAWWAIFGVLAVYFAGRRLIGPLPAAAAAALLAIHVIQTWHARYPNSEIVTQALLFAALLAHAYAHEDDDRFFGPVSASLLGLTLFTRLDGIIPLGVAAFSSLLARANGHRIRAGFLITLAAWLAAAGAYYTTHLRPYFSRPIIFYHTLTPVHLGLIGVSAVALLALLWAIGRPSIAALVRRSLPAALIIAVTVAGIYALYFREPTALLAAHDAHAVRVFADFYFTRVAFDIALAGYALVVWKSFWRSPALVLAITAVAFFFFYKMRIWPEHFWLTRRFVPVILPGALIFFAGAVFAPMWVGFQNVRLGSNPRISKAVRPSVAVVGMLAASLLGHHYLSASAPIRTHIEYEAVIPEIEQLSSRFTDQDLVLVESREASDVHILALPLAYIYARNVLVLYRSRPDKVSVFGFLAWAREKYKNVYFLAGGGTDLLSPGVGAEVVSTERFQVPEYARTPYDVYPPASQLKPFDFTIYKLVAAASLSLPYSLDIGGADDLYLVDFHPKERLGGGTLNFRWTGKTSYLLMGTRDDARELVLRLSAGRPARAGTATVKVFLNGKELGTIQPAGDFRDYLFPIPAASGAELSSTSTTKPSEIRIESTTWVPRDVLGGSDDRELGVMIDRAEIR